MLIADGKPGKAVTTASLFDQGLIQVFQAAATGLKPKKPYVLALAETASGRGALQPLSPFTANPAGAAIVNAAGPIRQIVQSNLKSEQRYLVIAEGTADQLGAVVQVDTAAP